MMQQNEFSARLITAYIGLGSNLDVPRQQIDRALQALSHLPQSQGLVCSGYYQSRAIGPGEQPDYVNAVARLLTRLSAPALLAQLQAIEQAQGRQRSVRWGARTLDLDLLLYGDTIQQTPDLQLPHPEMMNRHFVLVPLYELAPELELPCGATLECLVAACDAQDLIRLESPWVI